MLSMLVMFSFTTEKGGIIIVVLKYFQDCKHHIKPITLCFCLAFSGENNVYSSSTSGDGFNLPNIYPTNNDLLEGDGELDSTNPFPAIFSDSDSDHGDTDRGSDDEDITACWEEAWAFMGKLSLIHRPKLFHCHLPQMVS